MRDQIGRLSIAFDTRFLRQVAHRLRLLLFINTKKDDSGYLIEARADNQTCPINEMISEDGRNKFSLAANQTW